MRSKFRRSEVRAADCHHAQSSTWPWRQPGRVSAAGQAEAEAEATEAEAEAEAARTEAAVNIAAEQQWQRG